MTHKANVRWHGNAIRPLPLTEIAFIECVLSVHGSTFICAHILSAQMHFLHTAVSFKPVIMQPFPGGFNNHIRFQQHLNGR